MKDNPAASRTTVDQRAIAAIEDAIWEGAREWDAWAMPASEDPAKKAWAKIKELIANGK